MTETGADEAWAIVRDGAEADRGAMFLSEDQEWGPIETAIVFSTEADAANGSETLCPPFMPGHPRLVTGAELRRQSGGITPLPGPEDASDAPDTAP